MSAIFKKVRNGIKKVFKKIVKVVKKIAKSKIFKAIVLAAAVYFTAGAAMGAMGGAGAVTGTVGTAGAGLGTASSLSLAGGIDAAVAAGATSIGGATTGVMSTLAAGAKTAGTFLKSNQLLASTGLQMGSALMAGKAEEKAEKEALERREENNKSYLNVYEDTSGIMKNIAQQRTALMSPEVDANGQTNYTPNAQAAKPANIENPTRKYFNSSDNAWQNVRS